MPDFGWTEILAAWGAILSSVLGLLKIADRRVKVEITSDFRHDADGGKTIEVRNHSVKPIIVDYWELFGRGPMPRRARRAIESSHDTTGPFRIEAHDRRPMSFTGMYNFGVRDDETLYLRLWISGRRRAITRKVK